MKKLIPVAVLLLLAACEKKHCWTCETHHRRSVGSDVLASDTTSKIYCDRSESDIKSEVGVIRSEFDWGADKGVDIKATTCEKQ